MDGPAKSAVAVLILAVFVGGFVCLGMRGASGSTPRETDVQQWLANSRSKTVVDLTPSQLLKTYSADLGHVEFDQDQAGLASILKLAGEKVEALFQNFNNVSAREQIVMRRMDPTGRFTAEARMSFSYLVLVRPTLEGIGFKEERTNRNGTSSSLPLDGNIIPAKLVNSAGFVVTSGFASLCLYLHPGHQTGSSFRYLGKERKSPHLLVIAFAQKPEVGDFLAAIGGRAGPTPVLLQGLIWIDPGTSQIVRMRTDLLEPDLLDRVTDQTTDIRLSDVRFADSPHVFCLPRQVNVTTVVSGVRYLNTHTYSDYKLFRVETRIK